MTERDIPKLVQGLRESACTFRRCTTHTLPAMDDFIGRHLKEIGRAADELERLQADGYAAAQREIERLTAEIERLNAVIEVNAGIYQAEFEKQAAEIERLTALNAELLAALKLWGHPDCDCEFCFRSRAAITKAEGNERHCGTAGRS